MAARTPVLAAFALVFIMSLAGCDALLGGEEVARIPLQRAADASYAPVRILLRPDMSPVAFTLHADFAWGVRGEHGQWNSYRVILRGSKGVIQSGEFQVNSPEVPAVASSGPPATLIQPMLRVEIAAEDEYEIEIGVMKPAKVTLESEHLGVRMRVPGLPKI